MARLAGAMARVIQKDGNPGRDGSPQPSSRYGDWKATVDGLVLGVEYADAERQCAQKLRLFLARPARRWSQIMSRRALEPKASCTAGLEPIHFP